MSGALGARRIDPARSRPTVTNAPRVLESPVRAPQACRARARTRPSGETALIPLQDPAIGALRLTDPVPGVLAMSALADFPLCPGKHGGIQFP